MIGLWPVYFNTRRQRDDLSGLRGLQIGKAVMVDVVVHGPRPSRCNTSVRDAIEQYWLQLLITDSYLMARRRD